MPLVLDGAFYPTFTADVQRYSEEDRNCISRVVSKLLANPTSGERPGMLLGKIQSGKTKTFLGAIALGFDNGFDVAIILTKGTKALAKQTLARVRKEFSAFQNADQLQVFDIMTVPEGLTGYELNQKLIVVAKKQSDNLDRLEQLFREGYPQLREKRVLIIDDEADYASVGFRRSQGQDPDINVTGRQIDHLRQTLRASSFLQVTATPYSLYLQPEDLVVQGIEFRPIRPAFTELVPVNRDYVGSDYYFDRSQDRDTVASFIYRPVTMNDLLVLRAADRRRFRPEDALSSDAIALLRDAVCNFIAGGVIRRLQDADADLPPKKFAFLFHTESQRAAHAWQETVVQALRDQLTDAATHNPVRLTALLTRAYEDLRRSIVVMGHPLPALDRVIQACFAALRDGWLMITKVNSEQQVEQLLDEEGQLRLRTPLNVFIGGQILDRGLTIANLIGFFYGRRPQVYQQDTVLQHSRMFGFRPAEDLTVTRFYTEQQIYTAMRRMHESDVALRDSIEQNPDSPVIFIRRDTGGQVIPCSPNKILLSNTTTLRPFKRILPVGFQSDYAVRVRGVVERIDEALARLTGARGMDDPFDISLAEAIELLSLIERTLILQEDEGFTFDWAAARAALTYLSQQATDPARRGRVWCLVRTDRNLSRTVSAGSHAVYADAPDTTRTEGAVARKVAIDRPMLMLIRQNGREDLGWRGTPFYWPVIVAQQNIQTAIFAHETMP
jgi:Z1 domain